MAGTMFRSIFNTSLSFYTSNSANLRSIHTAAVYYAARKGTRAKARAKKVKVEVTKIGFIPHNERGKDRISKVVANKHANDSYKPIPKDDVFPLKYYRWVIYSAEDAVKAHQETHHPSMYNQPDAYVYAQIEFNMAAAKKNRYMDSFTRLSILPHPFPREEERTVLAFCKGPEMSKEVLEAGATTAGGAELIKKIQDGQLKIFEYDYVIAHPNIITELVPIRGLMKKKFPTIKTGTLDTDLKALVKKFAGGTQYRVVRDEKQDNFGSVQVAVGRLNMDAKQVAANIEALLKDLQSIRPKREGLFITRCIIVSPPSPERLKIDPFVLVDREISTTVQDDSDDEDEAVAATA